MAGLRELLDAATPPEHGEETWEQKKAWDRFNSASWKLHDLAPELAALCLDMGEFIRGDTPETPCDCADPWCCECDAKKLLARFDRIGKEQS